ncbi:MAG: sodium:calcium antiporter [candidate division Zixibacteria bacterium]|nr:sodium:calcium antiporter [candidate division Zixibacteria bacterium]
MNNQSQRYNLPPRLYTIMATVFAVTVPGFYLGLTHAEVSPLLSSAVFGGAIFGAAFILCWGAEAAQIDISESLAVAILALLAVLPEYAVDFVFTWRAAHNPEEAHFAIANMTGSNRLLVGLGWPVVLFLYVMAKKRKEIVMNSSIRIEIFYLAMATIYSFTIPLKGHLTLFDTVILVTLFALYTRRAAKLETVEPELVGPVKIIANMRNGPRRFVTVLFFLWAGAVIFFSAEPFAHGLVEMGREFGLNEFLLVQWLAPLASESPEFIVAATWALRGAAVSALKTLISSKVNQWTLLIGTIPLVFSISSGAIRPFPLDGLQQHELFLTAAQSLFGLAVLVNLRFQKSEGVLLATLFLAQLIVEQIRLEVTVIYIVLAFVYLVINRNSLIPVFHTGIGLKEK